MEVIVLAAVQWLHVFFGVVWFGSITYNNFILWPDLKSKGMLTAAKAAGHEGRGKHMTAVLSIGTVGLGTLRGILGGALQDPFGVYGFTYLIALVIGLAMAIGVNAGWYKDSYGRAFYLVGFPTMFTLMIAMRFGY